MKVFKALTLSFSRTAVAACLLAFSATGFAATTSQIATISSATTDGSASSSTFQLSVTSGQLANALTTASDIELSLGLAPQESHRGLKASVYTVIVAGGKFFKLTEDGSYAPWDGSLDGLTPFATNQTLASTNRFTLLDGKMAEAGSYLYFVAYGVEGESRLLFTPDPAQIVVAESDALPDESSSQAAETFEAELESAVVQAKCIGCHVEGGLARNSALQFQRTNTASALNNFASLSAYVDEKGAELLLSKITGGNGHAGGAQLEQESDGYKAMEKVIAQLRDFKSPTLYAFGSWESTAGPRQASFLTEITLEPRAATLRRATLLLQGRIPTEAESKSVTTDSALRAALLKLMEGRSFREFVVSGVNDKLLTAASNTPVDLNNKNWAKLNRQKVEYALAGENQEERKLWRQMDAATRRASGELVAHVIVNDKPYSEILTADYMMMNPFVNKWLEGTASFSASEGDDVFKPSRIKGYYYGNALERTVERANSLSSYRIVGAPVEEYPHTGLLSDFGFLSRYPTTATNRNRARARWVFYHFLGIDIEKSSQRPTDEAALTDRNNPTMNNPNCTVCHAILDPVAGAFQNWDDSNLYRRNDGIDALDRFYKYPRDGSETPYKKGDVWYRDMRKPGLFDSEINDEDRSLRRLAEKIVAEPAFLTASAQFWWPSVFGKPMIDKPAVEADQGYAAKYAAYSAQQEALEAFASALGARFNAKDMLVEMLMSPWFATESTASFAFDGAQYESQFGSKQLLTPEQLARKTRGLTGVSWRTNRRPSGEISSSYESFGVLLGGIDSEAVTSRATELTPAMAAILMTHATESACPAVVRQFAAPKGDRSLFTYVEESTLPLMLGSSSFDIESEDRSDWREASLTADVTPGSTKLEIRFSNPYCDYDGTRCLEQRVLYLDSVEVTTPSGKRIELAGNDARLATTIDWDAGYRHCVHETDGTASCYNGALSMDLEIAKAGTITVRAVVSAQQAPSSGGPVEAMISLRTNESVLEASTPNALAIRQQIRELYKTLHGTSHGLDSDAVNKVYEIFTAALDAVRRTGKKTFWDCALWKDGYFYDDLLSDEQLATFRTVKPGNDWYQEDWRDRKVFDDVFNADRYGTKYAWTAVMMFMLSHYDYLHE